MKTYIYIDNKTKEEVISIQAEDILKADKIFKKEVGYDVSKKPYIGCVIK